MKQKGAGSQCVRRKNTGSLSFRERYLSLRKEQSERVALFFASREGYLTPRSGVLASFLSASAPSGRARIPLSPQTI